MIARTRFIKHGDRIVRTKPKRERKFAVFFGNKLIASVFALDSEDAEKVAQAAYRGKWLADKVRVVELFGKGRTVDHV